MTTKCYVVKFKKLDSIEGAGAADVQQQTSSAVRSRPAFIAVACYVLICNVAISMSVTTSGSIVTERNLTVCTKPSIGTHTSTILTLALATVSCIAVEGPNTPAHT